MIATTPNAGATNPRVELARYRITEGEHVIYGQRIDGIVRLVDVPADEHGRRYVIERGLTSKAELDAIVADYVGQAARWDDVPAKPVCLNHMAGQRS
ncbi:MAG: hypothetical protein JHC95_16340 [Solirubrobacteraceae bacterium]|nr:hypothetical protein [Solirubrobacteraceae bacterium]